MKDYSSPKEPNLPDLEYTMHARRSLEKTTQDPYFLDSDPEMILNALMNEIRSVSFGDYLKRFIRRKRGAEAGEEDPETKDLDYLCNAFRTKNVPPSFTPTTAKIRTMAKNWLTQRTVNRSVVLLLGFALSMNPEEVNGFLSKALREPKLSPKNPEEVICWYCYRYQLPFDKYQELHHALTEAGRGSSQDDLLQLDSTVRVRRDMEGIATEKQLMDYLSRLDLTQPYGNQSVSARKQFELLYRKACEAAAGMKTEMEKDDADTQAGRYADQLSRNDRIYDYEKNIKIEKKREAYRVYTAADITPADIETLLYSAIPKDRNGNLIPMKESLLNIQFSGKRLNRQHIAEILDGKGSINRFDILTLAFFAETGETDQYEEPSQRYEAFIRNANQYLRDSDMDPLYVANPYESFLLMCMLTDDPLGSFADVWELSYDTEQ